MAIPQLPSGLIGWVLYDGDCGICRAIAKRAGGLVLRRGFAIAPLQQEWVAEELGIPPAEVAKDFRLIYSDGRRFVGADVYREILKRSTWSWPIYLFSIAPGFSQIFNLLYATFRDNRGRFSKTCGL